jgi:hypothetical protein
MAMTDDVKAPPGETPTAPWTVTGVQTAAADGRSRVEVVIRGKVEGRVDRANGSDQVRFAVWDDGQEKAFRVVDVPLGRAGVVTVRLGFEGRYLTVADGIGIMVTQGAEAGGECLFDLDPFFPQPG